jgi:hypothetical protein
VCVCVCVCVCARARARASVRPSVRPSTSLLMQPSCLLVGHLLFRSCTLKMEAGSFSQLLATVCMTWQHILQTLTLQIQTWKIVTIWQIILAPWAQEMFIFTVLKCSLQNCFQNSPDERAFFMSYFGLMYITDTWFIIVIVTIVCKYFPATFFRDKVVTWSDLCTWTLKWHVFCSVAT